MHCNAFMLYIILLLSLIGTPVLVSASEPEPTCTCQPTDGYLVTRLWTIVDANITDQDVIDEFNEGFAPIVTRMDGFQRYTAAKTGNSTTVFFMNAFDTEELAHEAQEAAKSFVNDGRLNGAITPNQFTEDVIVSYFNTEDCVTTDSAGRFMSTRLYDLPKGMTLDAMIESTSTVAVDMKAIDGFVSFASTLKPTNHTKAFFFNIYETLEGAIASNNAGNTNAEEDPNDNVPNDVVLIEETAGQIAFDYICAGKLPDNEVEKEKGDAQDSIPAADPLVGDESRDTSTAQSHHLGSVLAAFMCVALLFAT